LCFSLFCVANIFSSLCCESCICDVSFMLLRPLVR
jgi:hypothetical protein